MSATPSLTTLDLPHFHHDVFPGWRGLAVRKAPDYAPFVKSWISDRISIDPQVCRGKPVVTGTRIPVAQIVAAVASGQPWPEILEDYPSLTAEDLRASLEFAGTLAGLETLHA